MFTFSQQFPNGIINSSSLSILYVFSQKLVLCVANNFRMESLILVRWVYCNSFHKKQDKTDLKRFKISEIP